LDVRLTLRTTRRQTLTDAGREYAAEATGILERVGALEERIRDSAGDPRGDLRVTAPTPVGRRWVAPFVAAFARRYPDIRVTLTLDDSFADIVGEGFDVAIRGGPAVDSGFMGRRLFEMRRVVVASPAYLAERRAPERLEDLARHRCLVFNNGRHFHADWRFGRGAGARSVRVEGALATNNFELPVVWALAGLGLAPRRPQGEPDVKPPLQPRDGVRHNRGRDAEPPRRSREAALASDDDERLHVFDGAHRITRNFRLLSPKFHSYHFARSMHIALQQTERLVFVEELQTHQDRPHGARCCAYCRVETGPVCRACAGDRRLRHRHGRVRGDGLPAQRRRWSWRDDPRSRAQHQRLCLGRRRRRAVDRGLGRETVAPGAAPSPHEPVRGRESRERARAELRFPARPALRERPAARCLFRRRRAGRGRDGGAGGT